MRVLVVTQYFWPENFRINDLVAGLVERGHEVTVLTGMPNYPGGQLFPSYRWNRPRRETRFGADIVRVPLIPRGRGGGMQLVANYLSFALTASIAIFSRLGGRYDRIFVFETSPITVGIPAVFAKKRFRAPIFFWVLDLWPASLAATGAITSRPILGLVSRLVRWIYRHCDHILVAARGFQRDVEAHGAESRKITYFPNWIEPEYEELGAAAPPGGAFTITYAGNIGAAQDFPAVLEAIDDLSRTHPDVRWIFAGDGRLAGWFRDELDGRGLSGLVTFTGQISAVEVRELLARSDALLVSLRPDPIFAITVPGKVQTYLASGRPIVAMLDGEGAQVLVESGGAYVVAAGDHRELVRHIAKLMAEGAEHRNMLGARGREFALREFERSALLDRLDALLRWTE